MQSWKSIYPGVEKMNVAVMGCVVNGPGESQHADIGISLPGTGEHPVCPVFINGKRGPTLKGDNITEDFQKLISEYVEKRYGKVSLNPQIQKNIDAPQPNLMKKMGTNFRKNLCSLLAVLSHCY